jgi:hypothetical protein
MLESIRNDERQTQFVARASGCDAAPGLSPNKLRSCEIAVSLQLNRSANNQPLPGIRIVFQFSNGVAGACL